jgi:galactitol-specific phosphotransferase system IIC component
MVTTAVSVPALPAAYPTATVVVNVDGVDYPAVNNGDGTWTLADNTLPVMSAETVPVPGNEILPAGSVAVAVTVSPSTRLPGF